METTSHTVESLGDEIGKIVAERQALRATAATSDDLEANRRRLAEAQAYLSRLLIQRHLAHATAA